MMTLLCSAALGLGSNNIGDAAKGGYSLLHKEVICWMKFDGSVMELERGVWFLDDEISTAEAHLI
jgi:hypothetical protein